ncbi:MAG TPA: hypothetical protein VN031_02950 [Candidatus Microsaccharimonas sp.]|nr:hypothetical protein [Candidatus Microsaccharimonas sp.]
MSEQSIPDPDVHLPILVDPAVQRSIDQMHEFQAELDLQPNAPIHRVQEMVQQLDAGWFHMGELVSLSGNVECSVIDVEQQETETGELRSTLMTKMREDGEPQTCTYFARDVEFTSRGFTADTEPFMVGGLQVGVRTVLRMTFTRNVALNLPDQELPQQLVLHNHATVDEISMDFRRDSLEYNRLKSLEYFPEFMAEVEKRIDGTNRIAEDIMALKGLEATINPDIMGDAEVRALEAYVDELISVEQDDLPYALKFREGTMAYDPYEKEDVLGEYEDGPTLMARVLGVRLTRKTETLPVSNGYGTTTDPTIIEPRIAIQLLNADVEDDSVEVEVRLADVEVLCSIRQSFYLGLEEADEAE